MGFNTLSFWIVFIVLLSLYHSLPRGSSRNILLLVASYALYSAWDIRFLPFIIISTLVDFSAGFFVRPQRKNWQRNLALTASLVINLGFLCTFKYLLEIFTIFPEALQSLGPPLGISFYTFQTISYTLDCYRGKISPTKNLFDFALYVSFFPQLIAGPIEKAKHLLPQITSDRHVSWQDCREGFCLILLGLFKKNLCGRFSGRLYRLRFPKGQHSGKFLPCCLYPYDV